jgi:hypothetical protein
MKALFAQKALYSSSPILPQAAFPARGGAAGRPLCPCADEQSVKVTATNVVVDIKGNRAMLKLFHEMPLNHFQIVGQVVAQPVFTHHAFDRVHGDRFEAFGIGEVKAE